MNYVLLYMSATTDAESESKTETNVDVHATENQPESTLSEKQQRILQYLIQRVDQQTYFKSRLIADELGLSAKEVGANMPAIIDDNNTTITIEKWGYSSGTTWKVNLKSTNR
ncbi:MAG: hypothetical protein J07HQW2_02968 [Haloquadratum walsbyi J07HQW2]|uniref:DUF7123 domain-containing protein n=2 Tax=Haloquadratum walsbyi TaxID=293091 RepID=U1NHY2_9EURY|nr:MAG: hypothetical protein J07HQW2_02968 [Haloquadratum walsbyi J07HQW2]